MRASSVQYPDRLREGEDTQEDVTASKGKPAQYMNQSVFSMIAAAGSKVDFHARFDEDSSDSDEEHDPSKPSQHVESSDTTMPPAGEIDEIQNERVKRARSEKTKGKPADSGGLRALPMLNLRTIKEKNYMSQSTILPSQTESPTDEFSPKGVTPRDAPVMGKMLEAQAELSPSTLLSETQKEVRAEADEGNTEGSPTNLVVRLKEIFEFEKTEEVISGASICIRASSVLANDGGRVSMLAPTKRFTPRLHVHYTESYLLLRISTQEIRKRTHVNFLKKQRLKDI